MVARRLLLVTVFLLFVADTGAPYAQWFSPFSWAHDLLGEALPWKIRPFDHITALAYLLAMSGPDGKGPRVSPMRNALIVCATTTVVFFGYGVARGGDAWAASWQVYLMLSGVLFAASVSAAFRTPEHYVLFAKMLLMAGTYRAVMCWMFWFLYIRTMAINPLPELLTSHDDTVLWVVCMLILLIHILAAPAKRVKSMLLFLFFAGAVLFNQRRIAWISLAMGLALAFALLPRGKMKRRAVRAAWVLVPLLFVYVAVGWGRTERIFKPLQSFATVSTEEDNSTKARNVENLGLIATSNSSNILTGTGWGHKYIEVSSKYTIAQFFPLWQYIPHNSILGLLAYTGVLGFFGYWLPFPTAMFINARMARLGNSTLARQIGIIGAAELVVCANQFFGDMGIYYSKSVYLLSLSYAVAGRLPILVGAWPAPGSPRRNAKHKTIAAEETSHAPASASSQRGPRA